MKKPSKRALKEARGVIASVLIEYDASKTSPGKVRTYISRAGRSVGLRQGNAARRT